MIKYFCAEMNPPTPQCWRIKRSQAQLLCRMQQFLGESKLEDSILGESKLEDSILKQLFLQSLPNNVRIILTSLTDTVALEQLAELVDRIS